MDSEATWDLFADFQVQAQQGMTDLQQDIPKAEQKSPIEKLLRLWDEFVQATTEDTMAEVQGRPEFRKLLGQFCQKAPRAAEILGTSIIENVRRGDAPKGMIKKSAAQPSASGRSIAQSRKHKAADSSYRPPKYAKATCSTLAAGEKHQSTRLTRKKPAEISNAVDGNAPQDPRKSTSISTKGAECDNSKATGLAAQSDLTDDNATQDSAKAPFAGTKMAEGNSKVTMSTSQSVSMPSEGANTSESVDQAGSEAKDSFRIVCASAFDATPLPIRKEFTSTDSSEQAGPLKSPKLGGLAQPTPAHQIKVGPIELPQTEEIHREKIPTSIGGVSSSPALTGAAQENARTLTDYIIEAIRIIHGLGQHQDSLPRNVHVTILQSLRGSHQDMLVSSDWSSGSVWVDILEAGSIEGQKVTILRMLEYIGAWEWYDGQVRLLQESGSIRTRKNKPASRKLVATHVLDKIQPPGECIKSLGRLTVENDERIGTWSDGQNTLTERISQQQRQRIKIQLSRGQRLSTRLVKELGLGILFSPNIWDYTKKDAEQLEQLIKCVQGDPKHMMLLQVLSKQLEMFILEGRTDIRSLFASLLAEGLLSESDSNKIVSQFPFTMALGSAEALDAAIDRLKCRISNNVLGKPALRGDDIVSVRSGTEFTCDMFEKLRHDEWFDAWLLLAGMEMSDKPSFTKYHPSVPLDETFGKRGLMRRIPRPFLGLKRKIKEWKGELDDSARLVYFCPLNHHCNHFTALEINEQDRKIYHYDSMAAKGVIDGTEKSTRVRELVQEEFGHLKFEYVEAPTPQQEDTCCCGPMVVRNIRRRMFGLSVGGWRDKVDPDRVRMDMVEDFEACISDNALWGRPDPTESREPLVLPNAAPQKSSAKRSAPSEIGDLDTPTKRPKRLRNSSG